MKTITILLEEVSIQDSSLNSEEENFRESYASELKKKRQQINNIQRGYNELEEERRQVNMQAVRTPGRRGEEIKKEEIEKEFARRYADKKNT